MSLKISSTSKISLDRPCNLQRGSDAHTRIRQRCIQLSCLVEGISKNPNLHVPESYLKRILRTLDGWTSNPWACENHLSKIDLDALVNSKNYLEQRLAAVSAQRHILNQSRLKKKLDLVVWYSAEEII